jgi:hypothetical protein
MGLLDDGLKGSVVTGLAVGIGAIVLAPAVLPALAGVAKPLLKAAVKSGIVLFEKGKETAAELSEVVEDIVAEARAVYESICFEWEGDESDILFLMTPNDHVAVFSV